MDMPRTTAIVASLLGFGLSGCLAMDEGTEPTYQASLAESRQQIIGGVPAVQSEFSGVAALIIAPADLCTASLIHEQWLVTAAHCLQGKTTNDVQILFDRLDIRGSGGSYNFAAQLLIHPGYTGALGDNDIALIKLADPESNRQRYPVARNVVDVGVELIQVGYGSAAAPNTGSGIQRKLVTTSTPCASVGAGAVDATKVLCFAADDGNGTCFGDSGGPSFIKAGAQLIVAGVTSFGANPQCTGYDVATMVASEIAFVDQYVPKFGSVPTSGEIAEEGGCSAGRRGAGWMLMLVAALVLGQRRRAVAAPPERRAV
jgi:secreted trypsin-like serine protease